MTDDPILTAAQTAEHERLLLGAALQDADTARELLRLVPHAGMFADGRLARVWSALRRVLGHGNPGSLPEAVADELGGDSGDVPNLVDLHELSAAVPSAANASYYARRVVDAFVRREAVGMIGEAEAERTAGMDTLDLLAGVEGRARRLRELLADIEQRPHAVPVADIAGERPERLLHCTGRNGALLSAGGVLVLAGEGGIAKTPLALSIAAGMATRTDGSYGPLHGGLFHGIGAPVLIAGYEDAPSVSADRLRKLAAVWWPTGDAPALRRLHILNMAGRALFGPAAGDLYGARPGPLPGWSELWDEVKRSGARLVVIDPALCAYVGDANSAAPVRDFMGALAETAEASRCGVLIVAHSRKDARRKDGRSNPDPFDPGNVAGSTHWTDAARGALTLTWNSDAGAGARVLAVAKANYGPSRILTSVDPVRSPHGEIVGFTGGPWQTMAERDKPAEAATNGNPY
ncbi:MAG: AAA family ATPase [Spirochaetaceae bacterium]|nr:AAA family ATPase [Spirochaetaceae bacterium]